jgi:diguanylate cyclase (GGDEF)-like protein/PAS domain S-box-containing protein
LAGSNGHDGVQHSGEIISIRPVTSLEAREALRESEARLHALLSSIDDLVVELDENGIYLAIWTTDETLLVAPPSELLGRTVREALGDEIGRRMTSAVRRVLKMGQPELFEYRLEVPAGARWFQGRLAPIVGSASRTACFVVRDVTDQKLAEEARDIAERRLLHLATHDALTDLPNRAFFGDRLDHALKRIRRRNDGLAVLVLDVDLFKDINDTFGHAAGDEVLREVARRLIVTTRDGDSVARLGGDEFAIMLQSTSETDGARIAARVSDSLSVPVEIGADSIEVGISTGCAVFPRDGTDAESLLKRADVAMYIAKRARGEARTSDSST